MSQYLRVLMIEDSEGDAALLIRHLRKGGYEVELHRVETQPAMQEVLSEAEWDIIISDYSLPGFDGISALRVYQESTLDIPFILISGTIGEEIAVEAMRNGAHDYLMKDNLTRLIPTVQRELREAEMRRAHRQAQEALKANEKKYRLLVEHAPSGIYEYDFTHDRFISVNEVMCEYTGYSKEEFLSLKPLELLGEESHQQFLDYAQTQDEENIPKTIEYEMRGKNGEKFWANLQMRITREDDTLIALVVAHDITERKLAEQALQRYADRLSTLHKMDRAILAARSVEEIAQAAIGYIRQLVPCMAASVAMIEIDTLDVTLFTVDTDQPIGIPPGTTFALAGFRETDALLHTLNQGKVFLIEDVSVLTERWTPLDVLIALEMSAILLIPLLFQDDLLGFIGMGARDRTAFREEQIEIAREIANQLAIAIQQAALVDEVRQHAVELEARVAERTRELQLANEHLKALSLVKDEFVSNVSHELQTPITSMMLYCTLISSRPEQQKKYLDTLEREIRRLSDLIEGLLFLSRLDQNRAQLKLAPVDLNTLISQYVEDRRLLASQHGLELSFAPPEEEQLVLADESLLSQVFSILLTNAINYTPDGGCVGIAISQENNQWGVSVSDTGPGIEPSEHGKVFERFFRGRAGIESAVSGTGLGLSIAKEIVERHEGSIEIHSTGRAGEGTTFTVWLPALEEGELHNKEGDS